MIELEAERARARRYGGSVVEMVLGGGLMVSSALALTLDTTGVDQTLVTVLDVVTITGLVFGGLTVVGGIISLFVESPMERLFDRYAPVAIDTSLTPSARVHRGEEMLEAMANSERSSRITGAAESMVIGVLEAGLAVFFAADSDIWGPASNNSDVNRVIISTAFAIGAAGSIGEAIAKLVWERGSAEIAWEHWHTGHEIATVHTSRVRFTPSLTPTHGGATAGFSLRF
jgi:hypothetical protein